MGIKGLWTKAQADAAPFLADFVESIPRGSHLFVDAPGFMFQLYDFHSLSPPANEQTMDGSIRREFGGCYGQFRDIFLQEVKRLSETFGFHLVFYFDGPESYFKGDTTAERRRQTEKNWEMLFGLTLGDMLVVNQQQLPIPPLSTQEMIFELAKRKIPYVISRFEADHDMACACATHNRTMATRAFCYTSDSDFLAMSDCPVIRFGAFEENGAEIIYEETRVVTRSLRLPVWSRNKLCAFYELQPEQFVDWCVLAGNDYTTPFHTRNPEAFGPQFVAECPGHRIGEVLEFVRTESPYNGFLDEDLATAVAYSRAMYNLEDVTPFCEEKYKTVNNLDEESELEDGVFLKKGQKQVLDAWLQPQLSSVKPKSDEVVTLALGYLAHHLQQPENQSSFFTDFHLRALERMIKQLRSGLRLTVKHAPKQVLWHNVLAANFYQLVVKEVHKALKEHLGSACPAVDPSLLFDGFAFHANCKKAPQTKKKNEAPALVSALPTPRPAAAAAAPMTKLKPSQVLTVNSRSQGLLSNRTPAPRTNPPPRAAEPANPNALPADAHREEILQKILTDRVTIIHGETGCGKSSRIPVFLYEDAVAQNKNIKVFISQPRRLAVVNLKNRLQEQLGSKVGMRMGHGVREESNDTCIHFVTSGYLVQLLAHNRDAFRRVTHLIIDEVHERSVDSDLLCWLAKDLLVSFPHLRLVLMSATLHTQLYQEYFSTVNAELGDLKCLSVGARRYPVDIFYPSDLTTAHPALQPLVGTYRGLCSRIVEQCNDRKSDRQASSQIVKDQYDLAVILVRTQCQLGTGALIFVSGLDDIIELQGRFDAMPKYRVVAIHSHIPFEEQEAALIPAEPDEVKVVIATNAAESSVTLPDVDVVICCGMHKEVNYRPEDVLRSLLVKGWISKSSATQRAGRTGRVRPGRVFRLYSKQRYERFHDFQTAEINRTPLHEVVLQLQSIFEDTDDFEGVKPILESLIEPPEDGMINASLGFLHAENMLSSPDDMGRLTSMGAFAGHMPLDIMGSKLVIQGIAMGVGAEAAVLAAALAQPKSIFRIAHPLIFSDPDEYNAVVQQTFLGSAHFDGGVYSEPIMMLNVLLAWRSATHDRRMAMCHRHGLAVARVKHFVSTAEHLVRKVNEVPGLALQQDLDLQQLSAPLSAVQVNRLRLILLWSFYGNFMRRKLPKKREPDMHTLVVVGPPLKAEALRKLFPHPIEFRAQIVGKRVYEINSTLFHDLPTLDRCVMTTLLYGLNGEGVVMGSCIVAQEASSGKKQQKQAGKQKKKKNADPYVRHLVFVAQSDSAALQTAVAIASQRGTGRMWPEPVTLRKAGPEGVEVNVGVLRVPGCSVELERELRLCAESTSSVELSMINEQSFRLTTGNFEPDNQFFSSVAAVDPACFRLMQMVNPRQQVEFLESPCEGALFADLPLGKRLFNAYCLGYKDKKMKVREDSFEDDRARKSAPVVGSAEWRAQKDAELAQEGARQWGSALVSVVTLGIKAVPFSWEVVTINPADPMAAAADLSRFPWSQAFVSSRCLTGYSNSTTSELVTGVAYSSTQLGSSDRPLVACEGVTLFPSGTTWISRALLCIGKVLEAGADKHVNAINGMRTPALMAALGTKSTQVECCLQVRALLSELKDHHLGPSRALTTAVDQLFLDFAQLPVAH